MSLDVEVPDPPDLTNRPLPSGLEDADAIGSESDLHREELEALLRDDAWEEGFEEWAEYTDLSEAEYRSVQAAGLLDTLDFYWDPVVEEVCFEVPDVPTGLTEPTEDGGRFRGELEDLSQTVVDVLEDGYVDWGGQSSDDTWSDELFDDDVQPED